ncbi:cell division protein FtsA [Candidatus Parcubacteria bacterium]|nr:cell division protein FtsA [Candidatus Parcubacteria bacterium]
MARLQHIVGIDCGSSTVQTVIASEPAEPGGRLRVIGVGVAPSQGFRRGSVVDAEEAGRSIRQSVAIAERMAGVKVNQAFVSIGGVHIGSQPSRGVIVVSRADGEISTEDVGRVLAAAQAVSLPSNREVIHVIPREYFVDGEGGIPDPLGMKGVRLEVDALLIHASSPYLKNMQKAFAYAEVVPEGFVLDVLAAAQAVLHKRQKELGVLAIDIGGGTVSCGVFEEGKLLSAAVLPVGAAHITNDIAIGLRTGIDVAEQVKVSYGTCFPEEFSKKELVELEQFSPLERGVAVPRRMVAEIIEARVSEMFDLVVKELKRIGRDGQLPAGAVLVGGGAKIPGLVDLAKKRLRLPVQLGFPAEFDGLSDQIDDPMFASAVGLTLWGEEARLQGGLSRRLGLGALASFNNAYGVFRRFLKNFLP